MTTKLGELKVGNVLVCDDIRQERDTNKLILIGVYSGDIVLPQLPAEIQLAFYIELYAPAGSRDIQVRLSGPQKGHGIIQARMTQDEPGYGTIATPRIGVTMTKEGTFRLDARVGESRWVKLISKRVTCPSVSQQPSEQSPPDVPVS